MIYKYRSFETSYKYDIFTKSEVYFAKPSEFNDPFESRPQIAGFESLKERRDYIDNYVKRELGNLKYKDRIALKKALLIRLADREIITNDIHKLLGKYGIFSSSEKWDQCLMWSHYSDGHKGFCVGFDFDSDFDDDMGMGHKVVYATKYPRISPEIFDRDTPGNDRKLVEVTIATKSTEWFYEQEIRYVKRAMEGGSGIYKFCNEKVKEVIIGACVTPENKREITDIITMYMPWVIVYQAIVSTSKYELSREPIFLVST
jgi:hypothetical protein